MKPEALRQEPALLLELDLQRCVLEEIFEPKRLELASEAMGLVGWFDLHCCQEHADFVLSTSPFSGETHWQQCVLPFDRPQRLLELTCSLRPQSCGLPELTISLKEPGEASERATFYVDKGHVEYGETSKRRKRQLDSTNEDLEAVYFASDVQELLDLAQKALSST